MELAQMKALEIKITATIWALKINFQEKIQQWVMDQ